MALLNVQERTVETRIAYVGVEESLLAANIAGLEARAGTRAVAEGVGRQRLSVGSFPQASLRDCSLAVTVVALGGSAREALESVLEEADAIVVVLDADAATEARSRDCIAAVGELVAERVLPVVVQWNGSNEGSAPDGGARHTWSTVCAAAGDGRGIDETLDKAMEAVMEAMTGREHEEEESPSPRVRQGDGNPLLTALQRVLEQTAEAQAAKLSSAVTERIEARIETRLGELTERLATVERSNRELAALVGRGATHDDLETFSASMTEAAQQRAVAEREKLAALESANDLFWRHVTTSNDELLAAARHSCSREDLATAVASVLGELRRTNDALETRVTELTTSYRKTNEGLGNDLKRSIPTKEMLTELTRQLTEIHEHVSALRAAVATLPTLDRVSEATAAAIRHGSARLGDQVRLTDARVSHLGESLERMLAAESERNERIDAAVSGIAEEMKKPKKGWFG